MFMVLQKIAMGTFLMVVLLATSTHCLSSLEKVVKEIGLLEHRMLEQRSLGGGEQNARQVMGRMQGFEDKRMLRNSQAYIKEFLKEEKLTMLGGEKVQSGHRRVKRQTDSNHYNNYAVAGVYQTSVYSHEVTESDLQGMSSMQELYGHGGPMCWVLGMSVQCLVSLDSFDVLETALPAHSGPKMISSVISNTASLSSSKDSMYVIQTFYEDSTTVTEENMRCSYVVYKVYATYAEEDSEFMTFSQTFSPKVEVTSQPKSNQLAVSDGIFFVTFNPDTVDSEGEGLHLFYYSISSNDFAMVTSSSLTDSVFTTHRVTTGIKDVVLFTIGSLNYLAVARDDKCFLYEFVNSGTDSVLKLNQKFKHSASTIKFFANSYGTYLILVDSSGQGTTYLHSGGEFIQMQEMQEWGTGQWSSQRVLTSGLLPEQEIVLVGSNSMFKFLKFDVPGILVNSSTVSIAPPDGGSITGLSLGRKSDSPWTLSYIYFIVCQVVTADGEVSMHFHELTVSVDEGISDTNLGDLGNFVLQLENNVEKDHQTASDLMEELKAIKLTDDVAAEIELTAQTVTITGTTTADTVEVTVVHDTSKTPTFSDIDYNEPTSALARAELESTTDTNDEDYIYKNSILKSGPSPTILASGGKITAPIVTTFNVDVAKLNTTTVSGKDSSGLNMTSFLTKSLRTVGPQSLGNFFMFGKVEVLDTTEFNVETAKSNMPVEPQKYIDTSKSNTLPGSVAFTNVHFQKAPTFETTVNGIELKDIVTTSDAKIHNAVNPILIHGAKTFSSGITADSSITIGTLNDNPYASLLSGGSILYKEDSSVENFVQTVTCDSFYFKNIQVLNELTMFTFGSTSLNVSKLMLDDIVVTNKDNVEISGPNTFTKDVSINNLKPSTINDKNPNELLINGADQDIQSQIVTAKLVTGDLTVSKINHVDLNTEVARTDIANTFTAEITFTDDLAISSKVDVAETKTIAGVDISELGETSQKYEGIITVTNSLVIQAPDISVTNMDFGAGFINIPVDKDNFDNYFLYKDTAQEMPSLASVDAATTLNFDQLILGSTLDGLDLTSDVVHTYGEETTSFMGINFNAETTFKNDIHIVDEDDVDIVDPRIGGVDVTALHEQIFCPSDGVTRFDGIKTLKVDATDASEVTSYFDVTVNGFIANDKDFKSFSNSDVADLSVGNNFAGKMTFAPTSSLSPGVDVTGDFSVTTGYDITATDLDTVLLNGKNIKDFHSKIVMIPSGQSFTVTTPIEFAHLTVSESGILNPDGTIDDEDPVSYLDARVLLDDTSILNVELTSPTITFKEGVTMTPDSDKAETYFAGQPLASYKDSLYDRSNAAVSGKKTFAAGNTLIVHGDLTLGTDFHPFGVDISTLAKTGLTKSTAQTIDLKYTIDSISKVEKIISDKIDGALMADICLIDADCEIACPVDGPSPCATFSTTVTTSNGINIDKKLEDVDMSTVLASLAQSDKSYNLDKLEVPNGDFSWNDDIDPVDVASGETATSTSNTVSDLYQNLVVKSDKDWSLPNADATAVQDITATIKFKESIIFYDVLLDSKKINEGSSTEVNPEAIITDSASKADANVFTASKTFYEDVVAKTATVKNLEDVMEINEINIADYRANVLVKYDEENPDNENFEQEVTGVWSLDNGIKVDGRLSVDGTIDGVEVDDFVRRDVVGTKQIPAVTFKEGATVSGKIVTTGTDFQSMIDDFFTKTIKVNDASTIEQNLKFTGDVTIETDVTLQKLNGIPANTWVETDTTTEEQVITEKKTFDQETVSIKGNLLSDDIANVDLSVKYADAMKIDEEATITGPSVEFSAKTTLITENFEPPLDDFSDLLDNFVEDIGTFVNNLHKFYTDNIVSVLPLFLREVEVARQLGLGKLGYMEELTVPSYLTMESNENMLATSVSAVEMDNSFYSLNFIANSTNCGLTAPCYCQESRLASSLDQSGSSQSNDKTFSFSLSSGVFTISSKIDSFSDVCSVSETPGLIVSGILTNSVTASANLNLLSTAMVGANLIPQDLNSVAPVGYVEEVQMWELGKKVYLAVATTYRTGTDEPKVQLYEMDLIPDASEFLVWVDGGQLDSVGVVDIGPVMRLEVVKFTDSAAIEKVHLFVGRSVTEQFWGQDVNDIWVYEMSYPAATDTTGLTFQQKIAAPGLVDMEVMLYAEGAFSEPEVLLIVAGNIQLEIGTDAATVSSFVYNTTSNKYKVALLPDNVQVVGDRLVKMVSAKVARHTVVFLAESNRLSIYKYVPYQGLRLVKSLKADNILDFAVYSEWGTKGKQVMVYMLEGDAGSPQGKLYTLKVTGTVPTVKLSFSHYQA